MKIEAGEIVQGKVTGLAKFGAFVEVAPNKSGLVYISEISNTYVKEVSDFLSVGQEVTVKILGIDEKGRINLSIKQALPPDPPPAPKRVRPAAVDEPANEEPVDLDFEDKLKRFMKDSDSRLLDIKRQSERHGTRRRR